MVTNIDKLFIFSLLLLGTVCLAMSPKDTTPDEDSKFYNIAVANVSDNGKWIVAVKVYKHNYDTAVILGAHQPALKAVIGTLTKMTRYSFVKGDQLLASGAGKAILWNLATGSKKECSIYSDDKKPGIISGSGVLEGGKKYFLLTQDSSLYIYNFKSELLHKIDDVQQFRMSNSGSLLFMVTKTVGESKVLCYADNKITNLYRTLNPINSTEESASGNFLILKEAIKEQNKGFQKVVLIDARKWHLSFPDIGAVPLDEYIRFTEIRDGEGMMVAALRYVPVVKGTVDIWYGNDGNLEAKQEGCTVVRSWMWKKEDNTTIKIPSDRFSTVLSLDHPDCFIMFNRNELQNYSTLFPLIHAYLYDLKSDSYKDLGIMQAEISVANGGEYFLYKNKDGLWVLVDMKTSSKKTLTNKDFKKASFSPDNKTVIFESSTDLWKYDIATGAFTTLDIAKNDEVKILTKKENDLYPESGYNFHKSIVDLSIPMLLSVTKNGTVEKTFLKWNKGRLEKIMGSSNSNIVWYKTSKPFDYSVYVEESLHLPPQIVFKETKKEKPDVIFKSNDHDHTSAVIKRDLIRFKNPEGKALKGLLYYPVGYDTLKKYPMVVHIYEVQSRDANQYLSPLDNFPVGFKIKKLLEEGYFVYLPDIVNDSSGVGWSALNCVERSLDALKKHPNVDFANMGLIGHSFGGYRTNFIATHSNHFKTYISGAGAIDLIRMCFSYNYTSSTPFYWQFEEGQYNMHASFAENQKRYLENNPILNVHNVNAPILLWTGEEDKRIVWDQTMEFYIGLKRNKKDVVALFYPGESHVFTTDSAAEKDLASKIQDWWDYFLKGKTNVSWINQQMKKE